MKILSKKINAKGIYLVLQINKMKFNRNTKIKKKYLNSFNKLKML